MKKQLLILTTLFISVIGYSQTFFVQDTNGNMLRYTVTSSNTVSLIVGSTINNTNVAIPASVPNVGTTYSVTGIDQGAFNNANLTSVILPSNLQTIGDFAFGSNQLTGLTIPSSVTSIGSGAFRDNNSLTSVTVLATVPPTITTANNQNDTFYDTQTQDRSDIDLIILAGTTGAYVTDTGALWTGFKTITENLNTGDTYVYNFITYEVISVANSTVKVIGYNISGGSTVNIPTTIPNGLITYNVTEIGNNVSIGNTVNTANNITVLTIPDTVTSIGSFAFPNNSIETLIIPDSVVTIAIGAFANNFLMTSLTLGNNLETIGEFAFRSSNLGSLVIPNSVTNISSLAFTDCGLTDLELGTGLQSIDEWAFSNNPSLQTINSLATTPPTIGSGFNETFGNHINSSQGSTVSFRGNITLIVPDGTVGAYATDPGALWTGFNSVVESSALSTSDFELEHGIKLITNTDELRIISSGNITLKNLSVFDITGKEVIIQNNATISEISDLPNGIYILKAIFEEGILIKKFAK